MTDARVAAVHARRWLLVTALAALAYGLGLQQLEPYFFLWDDNVTYHLPVLSHNARAVFDAGTLPHVNLHQYLGQPHLAMGQTAALYPPAYLGLLIARLLGDLRALPDILVTLHLIVAALGMHVLLRLHGARPWIASAGGLLWITAPFVPLAARSWLLIGYVAALLPWNLFCLERLIRRPTLNAIVALAGVKALLFLQGYVQYAVLAATFDGIYIVVGWLLRREMRAAAWATVRAYALALLATGAFAAPLLVPMLEAARASAYRATRLGYDEFISNTMPFGAFAQAQILRMVDGAIHQASGALFYVGLPVLALLASLLLPSRLRDPRLRPLLAALITGGCALLLSTRLHGVLYHVPLYSSFRWHFKLFLIALVFWLVAAGGAAEALARRRGRAPAAVACALVAALALQLAIVAVPAWRQPFGPNRLVAPVETLRDDVAAQLGARDPVRPSGRVVSMWMHPHHPRIERLLPFHFATLAGVYHMGGYEPLIGAESLALAMHLEYSNIFRYRLEPRVLQQLELWGVRWLLLPDQPNLRASLDAFPGRIAVRRTHADVLVAELTRALPLISYADRPATAVDAVWGINEIVIDAAGADAPPGDGARVLRLALAPLPWWTWSVDGAPMGAAAFDAATRQMVLDVPAGARQVTVRYRNVPFTIGLTIALFSFGAVLAAAIVRRRRALSGCSGESAS
ncbi:MAG: hypothetical protein AAF772_05775 [Acidobacteriota bacterium]